jgi:hypothetical protein
MSNGVRMVSVRCPNIVRIVQECVRPLTALFNARGKDEKRKNGISLVLVWCQNGVRLVLK